MPIPKSINALLTHRERSIGELLTKGYSPRAIAAEFELSIKTVEVHLTKMRFKCNVRTTPNLVLVLSGHMPAPTEPLAMTKYQLRVWALKKAGTPDKEIAAALGIGYNTVKIHVQRIRARMGIPKHIPTAEYLREQHEK